VNPEVEITYTLERLHGIKSAWLADAPTITEVKAHIEQICSSSVFVGHSVKHDLLSVGISGVRYVDTSFFEDYGKPEELEFKRTNPKKLKELCAIYLNAEI